MSVQFDCVPYGDSAVLATARGGDPEKRWQAVQTLARAASHHPPHGLVDMVASFDTLLLELRTATGVHRTAIEWVMRRQAGLPTEPVESTAGPAARVFDVWTVFGGEHGPDLEQVAREVGLTAPQVVTQHCAQAWTIRVVGAPVGAPMMDGGRLPRSVSRRPEPRVVVPAGSVALAGAQCVIYPVKSPGGWRLIGRTPLQLTDVTAASPIAHRPGDIIRFLPIPADQWDEYAHRPLEVSP